jgi:ABC-type multidrug transport system fused ATPase/permease subunit
MSFGGFVAMLFFLAIGALILFFGLSWLHVPVGSLIDWLIGVAIVWWLGVVTTLPWNAHFAALRVVEEAQASRDEGIVVNEEHVAFAWRMATRFRTLAIGLHLLTAAVLFVLAYFQVIAVGYLAAVAALALTFARPAARAYEHLAERLRLMQHQVRYPREDVMELRNRVQELESQLKTINTSLDASETDSWAHTLAHSQAAVQRRLDRLDSLLEELTRANAREHEALARQTAQEIAKLSEDARFLNQVRELIRFVKDA